MATQAPQAFNRASDYVKGIGANLDTYQGRDVLLRRYEVSQRPMRGQDTDFVTMVISEFDANEGPSEETVEVHAWSSSLAEKIAQIPEQNLPVLVKFFKTQTASGFKVWNVE